MPKKSSKPVAPDEHARRAAVDPLAPLHEQFRQQKRILNKRKGSGEKLTNTAIAAHVGLSVDEINRFLSEQGKAVSPETAVLVGDLLRFDVGHVALVHFRDRLREVGARFNDRIADLERLLTFQNPFRRKRSLHRLAFRGARQRANLSLEDLARGVVALAGPGRRPANEWRRVRARMAAYERGTQKIPANEVTLWAAAMESLSAARCDLDGLAAELAQVHDLKTTTSWTPWKNLPIHANGLKAHVPESCELLFGFSPTIFGAVYVELFQCRRPADCTDEVVLSAEHRGWEIGIVLEGAVRLTLKRRDPKDPDSLLEVGTPKIYERHDIVAFSSALVHEVTFLHQEVLLASINVRSNVYVGRRLDGGGTTVK